MKNSVSYIYRQRWSRSLLVVLRSTDHIKPKSTPNTGGWREKSDGGIWALRRRHPTDTTISRLLNSLSMRSDKSINPFGLLLLHGKFLHWFDFVVFLSQIYFFFFPNFSSLVVMGGRQTCSITLQIPVGLPAPPAEAKELPKEKGEEEKEKTIKKIYTTRPQKKKGEREKDLIQIFPVDMQRAVCVLL